MKKVAIKPEFRPNIAKEEEIKTSGATDEEKALYSMSGSKGWTILKEYIDNQIEVLDNINEKAMEAGQNFEEIGKNTVVSNLAKAVIKRILNKVADAKEACERPDGTTR